MSKGQAIFQGMSDCCPAVQQICFGHETAGGQVHSARPRGTPQASVHRSGLHVFATSRDLPQDADLCGPTCSASVCVPCLRAPCGLGVSGTPPPSLPCQSLTRPTAWALRLPTPFRDIKCCMRNAKHYCTLNTSPNMEGTSWPHTVHASTDDGIGSMCRGHVEKRQRYTSRCNREPARKRKGEM